MSESRAGALVCWWQWRCDGSTLISATAGAGSATLTYSAPASTGGSAISGYTGTCTANGQTTVTTSVAVTAPVTPITVTGLTGNVTYSCTVTATNSSGTGAASNSLSVTPNSAPPAATIAITTPTNNASIGSAGSTDITVEASIAPRFISRIDIQDGTTLLNSYTPPAPGTLSAIRLVYPWTNKSTGSHSLTAKVTDNQGTITTSSVVNVQVLGSPTISLSTLSNFALAGSTIDLNATATPAAGTATPVTIVKVEFFADNGTTNPLIGTVTAPPYGFRWQNVTAGNYAFTAKVTDSQGLTVTSSSRSVSVSAAPPINLAITSPANQANVSADSIIVTGTYQAVANAGVVVNGVIATLDGAGNFLAGIPLTQGSNTVTATLTAPSGETATATVMIAATVVTLPVTVTADKSNGLAPLDVIFTITNTGDLPLSYSMDGGQSFALGAGATATSAVSYAQPGAFVSNFAITDGMGNSTTKNLLVEVRDDVVTDQKVRAVWNGMGDKLRAGDVNGALAFITGGAVDQYATLFNALKLEAKLANAVNALGSLRGSTVGSDIAELIISRETTNGTVAYPVWLLRGPDGVWRIESM